MNNSTIHSRIELIMSQKGLNYRSLGKVLGFSDVVVRNIITGRNKPSFDFLVSLLQTYDSIDYRWLFFGGEHVFLNSEHMIEEPQTIYHTPNKDMVAYLEQKLADKERELTVLNREIGKMEATIEQLKKCNPAADYLAYQSKLNQNSSNE